MILQPLKIVGRVLVGEGVLTKMCRKRPKARQFFLFNDILVYGNIVISKKKYNKQHIIPLEEVQLQGLEDNGRKCCLLWLPEHLVDFSTWPNYNVKFLFCYAEYRNGWLIRTATKSFAVYAATSTEKQEWMAHINKCIEDLLRKSKFFGIFSQFFLHTQGFSSDLNYSKFFFSNLSKCSDFWTRILLFFCSKNVS